MGIGLAVAATAFFAMLDTVSQRVGALVPVVMAVWFRFVVQTLTTGVLLWPRMKASMFVMHAPWLHVARGLLMLASSTVAFLSLRHIPVGEFTAVLMLVPLVITLLAAAWLGERVSWKTWALLLGGLSGALVIIRPKDGSLDLHFLWPLLLVLNNACYQILTSRMVKTEDPGTMHFITGVICLAGVSLLLPWFWTPLEEPMLWLGMGMMGLFGSLGHYVLIHAYQHAPASTLTPYMYAQIVFATLGGWVLFGHLPDMASSAGIALIVVCAAISFKVR